MPGHQNWISVIYRIWRIACCCCCWTDELTETPQDLQVKENHEEVTHCCANSLLTVTKNLHRLWHSIYFPAAFGTLFPSFPNVHLPSCFPSSSKSSSFPVVFSIPLAFFLAPQIQLPLTIMRIYKLYLLTYLLSLFCVLKGRQRRELVTDEIPFVKGASVDCQQGINCQTVVACT